MHNPNLIKSNPAAGGDSLIDHLRGVAKQMAAETRTAEEATDALQAQYNYTVEFRAPQVTRTEFNACKDILEKMQNKQPISRTERRYWDRYVRVKKLEPSAPSIEVLQTGRNKEKS